MTENREQPDLEKEKKTNTKLAVAVGAIGAGAFGVFYVLFFLMMIFKPGLVFSIMPIPSITTAALSDGSRTYLLVQKIDMSTLSPREQRQPELKHFIVALEGAVPGAHQEVPAYAQAIGGDNRLVFLSQGGYRTYDGSGWIEVKTDGIGTNPRGTLSPRGLYVISRFEDGTRLNRITDSAATAIPLPQKFLDTEKKDSCCSCAQLVWHQGQLGLFWSRDGSIAWSMWNGSAWTAVATSPFSGGFQVIADEQRLYLFQRQGEGANRALSYSVFANNIWTGPTRLPLQAGFLDWDVFLQQGKPMLFTQQFLTQTLYTIEDGSLANSVRLKGFFQLAGMIGRMALITVCTNLAVFLGIFGFSALINRYKRRSWTQDGTPYEFASLFRRFIAYLIDSLLIFLVPAIPMALFFSLDDFTQNPFRAALMILSAVIFLFLGGFLYHSLLEGLLGQTVGKKICGIRVLNADFTPCGLGAAFLRNLLRIVDSFFYYLVATISLAGTLKWQRLGDLVAETVVVRQKKAEGGKRGAAGRGVMGSSGGV